MAKIAIILHEGSLGARELRLGRILEFFGVPWKAIDVSELGEMDASTRECAVFGSIKVVTAALAQRRDSVALPRQQVVFYAFADDRSDRCVRALEPLFGEPNLSLQDAPTGCIPIAISRNVSEITGPMAGLELSLRLRSEDAVLIGLLAGEGTRFVTIMSAGGAPVFVRFQQNDATVFFCTSSHILDIDEPVAGRFYDVKDDFCSVVPLVMFVKSMFSEIAWHPQELGACLIVDDPLLRPRYGFCNFARLRDLMRQHGFTTNIAFIPWNWRRTALTDSEFFKSESGLFSVSIHGCDHTADEFGATSPEVLNTAAQLALSRMRYHQARTGIQHDLIMVFPQGVFSSACPRVLKRNGFLAAVNTETVPVDRQKPRTRIRDVWDVAIMAFDGFPIFTRRYLFHGIENFAFDLLLGKPCLIVAHHDSFEDGGAGLVGLIDKIASLNCSVRWRGLGQVIRRACRIRCNEAGVEEVEMYGNELSISNPSDREVSVKIRKRKSRDDLVSDILCDQKPITWVTGDEHYLFEEQISPRSEKHFRVAYQEPKYGGSGHRSLQFELAVAARRILSEVRDNYVQRSRFLSIPAKRLSGALRKTI